MKTARLIFSTLLIACAGCSHKAAPEKSEADEGAGILVRTVPLQQRTIAEMVTGLGRCEALPTGLAILTTAAEGRVIRILAEPGEKLKAGQEVVRLDPTLAQANLDEKVAARDSLTASLRLLESLPRPEEQNSSKLAIEQARLALEKAKANVDRLRPLRERNEISEAAMIEAESGSHQAALQLKAAEAQFEVLMLKPRPQAIDEARSKIQAADAAIKTAQTQIDQLTIRSPIAGTLDSLDVQLGQSVSVGASIGEVVAVKQLQVIAWLAVPDARRIRADLSARITSGDHKSATSRDADPLATGQVLSVGRIADPQTGNLPVHILFDNHDDRLTPGQVVMASIVVAEKKSMAVPLKAIQDTGEGPELRAVRQGKIVVLHPNLGVKDDLWIEVSDKELKPDEAVIVEGGYHLPDGTAVSVDAAAN